MPKIESERKGRAFIVTINRPEVRNAVDAETAGLLFESVEAFRQDDGLDVLILTGAGEVSFCAGADLKDIGGLAARRGALELACWCDFRVASRNAQFGVLNRRWGVPLVDGGTQRLPKIVGLGNALYLIESGVLIDAEHALRIGLVQEVVPPGQALARAVELAEAISAYPQASLRNDRQSVYQGMSLPLPEGLRLEQQLHRASLSDADMAEALRRYAEGQRPLPPRPPRQDR